MYKNGRCKAGKLVVTNVEGVEIELLDAANAYNIIRISNQRK